MALTQEAAREGLLLYRMGIAEPAIFGRIQAQFQGIGPLDLSHLSTLHTAVTAAGARYEQYALGGAARYSSLPALPGVGGGTTRTVVDAIFRRGGRDREGREYPDQRRTLVIETYTTMTRRTIGKEVERFASQLLADPQYLRGYELRDFEVLEVYRE